MTMMIVAPWEIDDVMGAILGTALGTAVLGGTFGVDWEQARKVVMRMTLVNILVKNGFGLNMSGKMIGCPIGSR